MDLFLVGTGLSLSRVTGYLEFFYGFPQSFQLMSTKCLQTGGNPSFQVLTHSFMIISPLSSDAK